VIRERRYDPYLCNVELTGTLFSLSVKGGNGQLTLTKHLSVEGSVCRSSVAFATFFNVVKQLPGQVAQLTTDHSYLYLASGAYRVRLETRTTDAKDTEARTDFGTVLQQPELRGDKHQTVYVVTTRGTCRLKLEKNELAVFRQCVTEAAKVYLLNPYTLQFETQGSLLEFRYRTDDIVWCDVVVGPNSRQENMPAA
jgi:hypothetical protein